MSAQKLHCRANGLYRPPLERQHHEGPVPVSPSQERLWLIRGLGLVRKASYPDMPMELYLSGHLDPAALSRAWAQIKARHEILRTRFQLFAGVPHQIIDLPDRSDLPTTDLSGLDVEQRHIEVRQLAEQEARERFDLAQGPLIRLRLIKLDANEHLLLLKAHHLVFDGWSLAVLLRELSALYTAYAQGATQSPLPELPLQYADYAVWQRRWLQGPILEYELQYWRERLAGLQPLRLPSDHARPQTPSFVGARIPTELSGQLTQALRDLARREGVTLYMMLLAAFQLLLSRWSGQTDIAVGSLVAGRLHRKTEALAGFFLNLVVIRTDLSDDPPLRALLARIRQGSLDAFAHQQVPFERLVVALPADRESSCHPLFQAQFIFQNTPPARLKLPGLTTRLLIGERRTARFDLTLELGEEAGCLSGYLGYAMDLFEAQTIERFRAQYQALLQALVQEPQRRLSRLG